MYKIKFIAVGDCFITRHIGFLESEKIKKINQLINKAEVKFLSFEMTTSSERAFLSAFRGGTWAKVSPEILNDIKALGFNLISWANNHSLDYLHQGVTDTVRNFGRFRCICF